MDGSLLAAKSRMVVVTLNYRLGILGITTLTSAFLLPEQALFFFHRHLIVLTLRRGTICARRGIIGNSLPLRNRFMRFGQ